MVNFDKDKNDADSDGKTENIGLQNFRCGYDERRAQRSERQRPVKKMWSRRAQEYENKINLAIDCDCRSCPRRPQREFGRNSLQRASDFIEQALDRLANEVAASAKKYFFSRCNQKVAADILGRAGFAAFGH